LIRHITMYFIWKLLKYPYAKIGEEIGGRTHATVINAIKKVNGFIDTDKDYSYHISKLNVRFEEIKNGISIIPTKTDPPVIVNRDIIINDVFRGLVKKGLVKNQDKDAIIQAFNYIWTCGIRYRKGVPSGKGVPISVFNKDNIKIYEFANAKEASRKLGIPANTVYDAIYKNHGTKKGYIFKRDIKPELPKVGTNTPHQFVEKLPMMPSPEDSYHTIMQGHFNH